MHFTFFHFHCLLLSHWRPETRVKAIPAKMRKWVPSISLKNKLNHYYVTGQLGFNRNFCQWFFRFLAFAYWKTTYSKWKLRNTLAKTTTQSQFTSLSKNRNLLEENINDPRNYCHRLDWSVKKCQKRRQSFVHRSGNCLSHLFGMPIIIFRDITYCSLFSSVFKKFAQYANEKQKFTRQMSQKSTFLLQ